MYTSNMFKYKIFVVVCRTLVMEQQNVCASACHFSLQIEQPLSKYLGSYPTFLHSLVFVRIMLNTFQASWLFKFSLTLRPKFFTPIFVTVQMKPICLYISFLHDIFHLLWSHSVWLHVIKQCHFIHVDYVHWCILFYYWGHISHHFPTVSTSTAEPSPIIICHVILCSCLMSVV